MKIGVFDSGLGGLIVTKSFLEELGEYDFLYYGDTKNLPYGDKSAKEVLEYCIAATEYLISKDCKMIIFACNTASAVALRYLQRSYMPKHHPDIKVLGVVVPTVEEAIASSSKAIGVIATQSTVASHMYKVEIQKINPDIKVQEVAAPELVPAIEGNDFVKAERLVREYVKKFENIDSLILGCTHYPLLKNFFRKYLPRGVMVISQDEFMGRKMKEYLSNHPEIVAVLGKNNEHKFVVSKLNAHYENVAEKIIPGIKIMDA
ncbi:MAG: glutamate racemase [Lactobacillus sp.]|jgi:glutamate racemase|nr:glutamate racemase [Lactobacillus sp.]